MSVSRLRAKPAANVCIVLVSALEERHRIFSMQLLRVRRRSSEPGIHDLRVATRRLIAVIDLVSDITTHPGLLKRRKTLRVFLKGLNALRDMHIRKIVLGKMRTTHRAAGLVLRDTRMREQELLRTTGRSVRLFDAASMQAAITEAEDALLRIGMNPALSAATQAILLGALAGTFARVVKRRELLSGSDPATVHRMRVAFKKLRYSLEILAPLLSWLTPETRKRLNAFQTTMGKIQDIVVALEGLATFEARRPVTGRMALIDVRQHLLRRRMELTEAFLVNADGVYGFWR
jgi:CHAD domain-containing protein